MYMYMYMYIVFVKAIIHERVLNIREKIFDCMFLSCHVRV